MAELGNQLAIAQKNYNNASGKFREEIEHKDDEIAKLKETVFARSWQFVCDTRNISKSGDVFPYDFIQDYMPEPLLLVNDKNKLKTMTNVN